MFLVLADWRDLDVYAADFGLGRLIAVRQLVDKGRAAV